MQGGIYFLHLYFDNNFTLKIGCSHNLKRRLKGYETLFSDGKLRCIGIIHSPAYCYTGKFILEKMVHYFFKESRRDKEIFEFFLDEHEFMTKQIASLVEFLNCHNMNVTFYYLLSEVPYTDRDLIIRNKQVKLSHVKGDNSLLCTPRIYQIPIIEEAITHLCENDKGCIFLPPGFGKTYIAMFILFRLSHFRKVIILTPQILICDEFTTAFQRVFVNSSKKLFIFSSEDDNIVDINDRFKHEKNFIIVATYQTFTKHKESFPVSVDMIVYDEAHHLATSETYQSALEYKGNKLFMTATPVIVNTNDEDNDGNFKTYSLNNTNIFGKCIYNVSLMQAISDGNLCDYRILVYPQIHNDNENNEEIGHLVSAQTYLNTLINVYGRRTIVVFYNRCEDAKRACDETKIDNCICHYLDGTMSKTQKQYVMKCLSVPPSERTESVQVLFNVNIVGEGVSIDCIDAILFIDARTTEKSIIQTIGRGLRLHPEKDCTIICVPPSIIDSISNIASALYCNSTYYKKDIDVSEHKTHILSRVITETSTIEASTKIIMNISSIVHMIEISKNGGRWMYVLKICVEYEYVYRTTFVSQTVYKDISIGRWICKQRAKLKNGKLSDFQLKHLDSLNTWREWAQTLLRNFQENLELCIDNEQKTNEKITHKTKHKGAFIGKWLCRQRIKYRDGQLNDEQLKSLLQLNTWQEWIQNMRPDFKDKLQSCINCEFNTKKCIIALTTYDGVLIGRWLYRQRSKFKKGKLTDIQLKELEKLKSWRQWLETSQHITKRQKVE